MKIIVQKRLNLQHLRINRNKTRKGDFSMKEGENGSSMPTANERTIWIFYQWAAIVAPIVLMFSHWYIFYVFSQNNYELLHYSSANEVCIAWIYSILYLCVPLMLLPASYLFRLCNLFRVPFVYFAFINVERVYYGSWFCTNEMVDTHYILIYCIICLYVMEIIGVVLKHHRDIARYIKLSMLLLLRKVRRIFTSNPTSDKMYDEIIDTIEKKQS